jgi:hypothetical protein
VSSFSAIHCFRHISPACLLLFFTSFVMTGCGDSYTGPSAYQQLKMQEEGFGGVIAAAGGSAKKEGATMHGFQMSGWQINLAGGQVTDEIVDAIIEVGKVDPVFLLNLSRTGITDDQLARLDSNKVLQKTVELDLSETAISDAGLDRLSNYYCITKLNLKGSKATSAGAKRLGDRMIASPITPQPFKKQPKLEI